MAKLPQEFIIEILLWLPVNSLLRFRCVSKSFCATNDSLDFINSHLARSSQNFDRHKLIFRSETQTNRRGTYEVRGHAVCDMNGSLEAEIPLPEPPPIWKSVFGCCNGLFLLYGVLDRGLPDYALWNPSTREYRYIPDCPCEVPRDVHCYGRHGLGLYYDSIDGYKVVLILVIEEPTKTEMQVWVFTGRSNVWSRIQDFPYVEYDFQVGYGHLADGSLHWLLCQTDDEQLKVIVAFDVGNQTFSLLFQPVHPIQKSLTGLRVLEGSLCISLFSYSSRRNTSMPPEAYLYMRKNDGVGQFTWIILYSVTEPLFFDTFQFASVRVLGYSKNRDKILLYVGLRGLVLNDIEEKSFGTSEIQIDPKWNQPHLMVASLVKIGGV